MKITNCDNCGYITETEHYQEYDLCDVCSSTYFSRAAEYHDLDQEFIYLAQSLGYLINAIIDAKGLRDKFTEILYKQQELDMEDEDEDNSDNSHSK